MIPQYNVHLINNKGSFIKVTGFFFNNNLTFYKLNFGPVKHLTLELFIS